MFITHLFDNPQFYFSTMVLVVFSICCHEYMHAQVALWQGDPTAAEQGHLTLNPLVQMGRFSLFICAVIGIAWGAVPVRPENFRNRYGHALVAFAGPATNFALFVGFAVFGGFAVHFRVADEAVRLFYMGAMLNLVLCLFNLLPVPFLDGGVIFDTFFPSKWFRRSGQEFRNGVTLFLLLFFMVFSGRIYAVAGAVSAVLVHAIALALGLAFGGGAS
jgi:Zn-dependent protease